MVEQTGGSVPQDLTQR